MIRYQHQEPGENSKQAAADFKLGHEGSKQASTKSWDQFKLMLNVAHPKRKDTLQLPLMADFATDPIPPKGIKDDIGQSSLFDPPNDEAAN